MGNWLTFAWQIEFVTVAVLIYGLITFLRAMTNLQKEFRIALLLVLASLIINVALGVMIGIFVTMGIGYEDMVNFWIIQPIVALVGAFLVMIAARKFFSAIEKGGEEE